ncbi:hypothetical protein [Streptomyces gardneri]|uniref:hypothetical protein n=1 Tax=Streptomyces gardneri TaxID=66892 RepID=UPI00340786BE
MDRSPPRRRLGRDPPRQPRIITDTDTGRALGLDDFDTRHSTATISEEGNLGGVSVLRVLEHAHAEPSEHGATSDDIAYGPCFNCAALLGTRHNH